MQLTLWVAEHSAVTAHREIGGSVIGIASMRRHRRVLDKFSLKCFSNKQSCEVFCGAAAAKTGANVAHPCSMLNVARPVVAGGEHCCNDARAISTELREAKSGSGCYPVLGLRCTSCTDFDALPVPWSCKLLSAMLSSCQLSVNGSRRNLSAS